jgi:hypothetical protein
MSMGFKKFLAVLMPTLAILASSGCNKDTTETTAPKSTSPAAARVTEGRPRTTPTSTTNRSQTLQTCLKEHSEADRKYCECFADHMGDGRGAPASAMACKNLRAENR